MSQKPFRSYSYVIFGGQKVGKTNIINRLVKDEFQEAHRRTLENQQLLQLEIDSKMFEIVLHDTAGQDGMRDGQSMKRGWRRGKDGFLFVFGVDCQGSLQRVLGDIREVQAMAEFRDTPIILVGNKKDLQLDRKVQQKTAEQLAEQHNITYFEISAKQSPRHEIQRLLHELVDKNQMKYYYNDTTVSQYEITKYLVEELAIGSGSEGSRVRGGLGWNPCEDLCAIM